MVALSTTPADPLDRWPAADLERVDACPACGSSRVRSLTEGLTDRVFGVAPGAWSSALCGSCESRYLELRPTPDSIGRAYSEYYTHASEPPAAASESPGLTARLRSGYLNAKLGYRIPGGLRAGYLVGALAPGKAAWFRRVVAHLRFPGELDNPRLLDVGCGGGLLVERMRALGWDAEGIDVDRQAVASAQRRGLTVQCCDAGELLESRGPAQFDAVVIEHVIEHVHDPVATLSAIRRLLRPGGQLVVITPNADAIGRRVYGRDWIALDPPRHLCVFSEAGLRTALDRGGLQLISRLRSASTAGACVRHSSALRSGEFPFDSPRPAGLQPLQARAIGAIERAIPGVAEELVFSAHAPRAE